MSFRSRSVDNNYVLLEVVSTNYKLILFLIYGKQNRNNKLNFSETLFIGVLLGFVGYVAHCS